MIHPVCVTPPDETYPVYRAHLGDEKTVILGIVGKSSPNDTVVGAMRDLAQKLGDLLTQAPALPKAEEPPPAA